MPKLGDAKDEGGTSGADAGGVGNRKSAGDSCEGEGGGSVDVTGSRPPADSRRCSRQFTGSGQAVTSGQTIHKAGAARREEEGGKASGKISSADWAGGGRGKWSSTWAREAEVLGSHRKEGRAKKNEDVGYRSFIAFPCLPWDEAEATCRN
ncbi:hypothetical protein KM043_014901 [Ampulex compressa]|nr:hypothetical protein KM043_014901 [Ampulex compressa]